MPSPDDPVYEAFLPSLALDAVPLLPESDDRVSDDFVSDDLPSGVAFAPPGAFPSPSDGGVLRWSVM